jgi:chromosome segregation ATPase
MQYLAKVHKKAFLGGAELALLAMRTSEDTWERIQTERLVETTRLLAFQEGNLVLVELDGLNQVTAVEDAIPWFLEVVEQYLSYGITPAALEQEIERAERWRQSLTLKSQEVDRRALETAARRDEIQELERHLKQEREELEQRWEMLKDQSKAAPDRLPQHPLPGDGH